MNHKTAAIIIRCTFIAMAGLPFLVPSSTPAQGSLTPPGAPAPVMKTLAQVEPRIPISAPFNISQPGSYYLTTNVYGSASISGIGIFASDVTLDLSGYALIGASNSDVAIYLSTVTNICIRNGTVRSWPTVGIDASQAQRCRFEDLQISHTGGLVGGADCRVVHCNVSECTGVGVTVFAGSQVSDCNVNSNGSYGIYGDIDIAVSKCISRNNGSGGIASGARSTIKDCLADGSGGEGIATGDGSIVDGCISTSHASYGIRVRKSSRVINCIAVNNGGSGIGTDTGCVLTGCVAATNTLAGISAGAANRIEKCSATSNVVFGISAVNGSFIRDCNANLNVGPGIQVNFNCQVVDNTCSGNGSGLNADGIVASSGQNRIDSNQVTGNRYGINAFGSNLIVRNSASANVTNYVLVGATFGPTNNLVGVGGAITNLSPWANFSY